MQAQPLFSVLIANYNNGKYITECLDSIVAQDYSPIEIILVDDASTDNSMEIIEPYLNKHPNIQLFKNKENKGVGYTKRQCIEEANGEICGFVDPDDALTPNAVSTMVQAHLQHPKTALIYSNYYACNHQLTIKKVCNTDQVINADPYFFNDTTTYISHFATFKKEFYIRTEGINPVLKCAEDLDLYLKLYDIAPCLHLAQTLYYYRIHRNGLTAIKCHEPASYWRWRVMIKRAESRGIDLEQKFTESFVKKERVKHYLAFKQLIRKTTLFKIARKIFK